MLKRYFLFATLFWFVAINSFSLAKPSANKKHTLTEPWKYGPIATINFLHGSIGVSVEHKHTFLGISVGLNYNWDGYFLSNTETKTETTQPQNIGVVQYKTIGIPIKLNLYPGNDRQFAIVAGIRPAYAISQKITLSSTSVKPSVFGKSQFGESITQDVSAIIPEDKISNLYVHYLLGFDNESDFGFIWGMYWEDQLTNPIKAQDKVASFCLSLVLGFNAGVFFY